MKFIRMAIICGVLVSISLWFCGCVKKQPMKPEETNNLSSSMQAESTLSSESPQTQYLRHTIQWPGESLIRISRWYTGSGNNWRLIAKANPSVDHRRIKIGDTILIPEDLLKTHQPMPVDYRVPKSSKKKKALQSPPQPEAVTKAPAPPVDLPPAPEKIELFGPIDDEVQATQTEETGTSLSLETID